VVRRLVGEPHHLMFAPKSPFCPGCSGALSVTDDVAEEPRIALGAREGPHGLSTLWRGDACRLFLLSFVPNEVRERCACFSICLCFLSEACQTGIPHRDEKVVPSMISVPARTLNLSKTPTTASSAVASSLPRSRLGRPSLLPGPLAPKSSLAL
jgi:hypothetical protein